MKRKGKGTATAYPAGIAVGVLFSFAITLIGAAIMAWLIGSESIPEEAMGYGAMVILFVSAAAGALMASTRIKRQRVQVSLVLAGVYYLVLIACTALFFGGIYQGMGTTALCVLTGACASILPAFWKGKGHNISTRKVRYR